MFHCLMYVLKGYNNETAFIATQGPKAATANDFWLMVWQEGSVVIVMLTNLKEKGKVRLK